MADARDAASGLMRRDARPDGALRAPSRDGTTEGRTGMMSGERPNEIRRAAPRSPRAALEPERVPVPTRRSERVRHPLVMAGNAVFTVLILIAIAGGILFVVAKQRFEAPGPLETEKIVNIPPRLGIRDIADLLVRESVIDHPWTFVVSAMLAKTHDDLRFGEYQFAKQASLHDVINTIIDGKVVQHQITVPEGLTSEQIVQRLLETDILSGSIKEIPREGSMLPESYRYPRGASRDQVIPPLQQAQPRVVQEVCRRRGHGRARLADAADPAPGHRAPPAGGRAGAARRHPPGGGATGRTYCGFGAGSVPRSSCRACAPAAAADAATLTRCGRPEGRI